MLLNPPGLGPEAALAFSQSCPPHSEFPEGGLDVVRHLQRSLSGAPQPVGVVPNSSLLRAFRERVSSLQGAPCSLGASPCFPE